MFKLFQLWWYTFELRSKGWKKRYAAAEVLAQ
jgi:hypothetical protein